MGSVLQVMRGVSFRRQPSLGVSHRVSVAGEVLLLYMTHLDPEVASAGILVASQHLPTAGIARVSGSDVYRERKFGRQHKRQRHTADPADQQHLLTTPTSISEKLQYGRCPWVFCSGGRCVRMRHCWS